MLVMRDFEQICLNLTYSKVRPKSTAGLVIYNQSSKCLSFYENKCHTLGAVKGLGLGGLVGKVTVFLFGFFFQQGSIF